MINVIVAGGRDFKDYSLLRSKLNYYLLNQHPNITIISGGATGADSLGEKYAKEYYYGVIQFPANWEKHGKAAGPIRNEEMAKIADYAVLFWDGKSKGTKNMIENCKKYEIPYKIVEYDN